MFLVHVSNVCFEITNNFCVLGETLYRSNLVVAMMDKSEMSLDDIIKQSKDLRNAGRRGGRGGFRRGGRGSNTRVNSRGGVAKTRRGGGAAATAGRFSGRSPFNRVSFF